MSQHDNRPQPKEAPGSEGSFLPQLRPALEPYMDHFIFCAACGKIGTVFEDPPPVGFPPFPKLGDLVLPEDYCNCVKAPDAREKGQAGAGKQVGSMESKHNGYCLQGGDVMTPGKMGIFSGILASLCCLGPVILLLLGFGSLGLGAFLGRYHWYFLAAAGLVLTVAWRAYAREKRRCDAEHCTMANKASASITLLIATAVVLAFAGLNFYTYSGMGRSAAKPETASVAQQETLTLPVEGMVCFTCEVAVEQALKGLRGVREAKASVQGKSVTVTYDPAAVKVEQMVEAINRTGYRAQLPETERGPNLK